MATLLLFIIIYVLLTHADDVYLQIEDKCIDLSRNGILSGSIESKFKLLFDVNGNTNAMIFVYQIKQIYHSKNIFHQFNKYLTNFHYILSNPKLLKTIKNMCSSSSDFKIYILFPESDIAGFHWAENLLKAYPIEQIWNNYFKSTNIITLFPSSNTEYSAITILDMFSKYHTKHCIFLNSRRENLYDYKSNDWKSENQPYYSWIDDWINNYKLNNNFEMSACLDQKWNIGLIQRSKGDRYLMDNKTEQNLYEELVNKLDHNLFNINQTLFDEATPIEQAKFMHDHDIIIGAHGASLTNIIFMNGNKKKCDGSLIRPALIEVTFRFGWCDDRDFNPSFPRIESNMTNEKLINRWKNCGTKYYKKAEFFAMIHSFSNHRLRYLELNSVRYGNEMKHKTNNIHLETMYVNTEFLVGEIMRIYNNQDYDFDNQLIIHKELYHQQGMLFPGEGFKLGYPPIYFKVIFVLLSLIGLTLLYLQRYCSKLCSKAWSMTSKRR